MSLTDPRGHRGLLAIRPLSEELTQGDPRWVPTEASPGSPEKIRIIQDRIVSGLPIFHPLDRGTRDMRWHKDVDREL